MKFEESPIWDDPFVKSLRQSVEVDLAALNKLSSVRMLLDTGSMDARTAAVLIVATGKVNGHVPAQIKESAALLENTRVFTDGPEALFKAEDQSVLKITLATLAFETTGKGLDVVKDMAKKGDRKAHVQRGTDVMTEISDLLVESGAHLTVDAKLLEKFTEGLDNMKELEAYPSRRKLVNEAAQSLKYAMMKGASAEVTHRAPRVDPDSQYARMKDSARTRFKL